MSAAASEHVAVLDIGSNAARLVIFDAADRAPVKIHTERSICNLGADLATTGRLNPEGVKRALASIGRFSAIVRAMKVTNVHAVATAALRDAADGKEFIAEVKRLHNLDIRIIDGEEEARLSALGVMMNGLGSDGVIGDYGGGSLELIVVRGGRVWNKTSLPIGSHRLQALKTREERLEAVDTALNATSFLKDCGGGDFYALGGAWRSMAGTHMKLTDYPLSVMDHYTVDGGAVEIFAEETARQKPATKRAADVAVAALAMQRLFQRLKPARIVFSGTGLREGVLFDSLSPAVKKEDPLLASCRKLAISLGRQADLSVFDMLAQWVAPLFADEDGSFGRLLAASCLLGGTEWLTPEDDRARQACARLLNAPLYGVEHAGRIFLALSQHARHAGVLPEDNAFDKDLSRRALLAGLAQRAAWTLTGGCLPLLEHAGLKVTPRSVVLALEGPAAALLSPAVEATMNDLAVAAGRALIVA